MTSDRSKAYSAAEKQLRQKHHTEFQSILRDELAKVGLTPASDRRRAKAEADLARITEQFPELVNPSAANAVPQQASSGVDF